MGGEYLWIDRYERAGAESLVRCVSSEPNMRTICSFMNNQKHARIIHSTLPCISTHLCTACSHTEHGRDRAGFRRASGGGCAHPELGGQVGEWRVVCGVWCLVFFGWRFAFGGSDLMFAMVAARVSE